MKRIYIVALATVVTLTLFAGGCKSEDQLAASTPSQPTVISPEVTVTAPESAKVSALTVSGSGKVTAEPDIASIYIEIKSNAEEAADAQTANAETVDAVTKAILGCGVEEKNLRTENVYLNEEYDYSKSSSTLIGYSMNTILYVSSMPVDIAGSVIGAAVEAGATGTNGLSFSISESNESYQDALKAAAADAAKKAAALAESLNVTISSLPLSVSETSISHAPVEYREVATASMSEDGDALATEAPISAGELTVTATVEISYEMLSAE